MKKFLFSMALALGAICMPSQASAAEVSSPVVNNIKATTTFQATPSNGPVVIYYQRWNSHYCSLMS